MKSPTESRRALRFASNAVWKSQPLHASKRKTASMPFPRKPRCADRATRSTWTACFQPAIAPIMRRGCKCKHIYAVEYAIRREQNPDGSSTVTESVTVTKTRKTYPQNWPAYNEAQKTRNGIFNRFSSISARALRRLHSRARPTQAADGRCDLLRSVQGLLHDDARRFTSDLCDAQAKGYIEKVPHFNSVLNYLENPDLFPILTAMIEALRYR